MLEEQCLLGEGKSRVGSLRIFCVLQQFVNEVCVVGVELRQQPKNASFESLISSEAINVSKSIRLELIELWFAKGHRPPLLLLCNQRWSCSRLRG